MTNPNEMTDEQRIEEAAEGVGVKQTIKVGTFVKVKETAYRHIEYEGVVTEVFNDIIQIFGVGYKPLGFHEFKRKEIRTVPIEKTKVKFLFDQELRELKANILKAENKFRSLESEHDECSRIIGELLK